MGLTSRDGIIPLFLGNDIGGPMARTVADAAAVLGVVAGYDPADPITALSQGNAEKDYTKVLERKGIVNPAVSEPYVKPIGTVIAGKPVCGERI
jgi:amidase